MNVSRFFGATSREAMRQVRMALGPDALIVSNRRVNGGVEILATDQTIDTTAPIRPADPASPVAAPASPKPSVSPADLMQVLGTMKGMLENGFDELLWGSQLRKAPVTVTVFQKLMAVGFSTALVRAMLKRLPESMNLRAAMQWCRQELVTHLPILEAEDSPWAPGALIALVGPTGVGKTTTVAKLAARCVRKYGPSSLVLITTDTYRIGAHEQLRIYGRMMGVTVHVAQDRAQLAQLIQAAGPDTRILIDNVGISQRDGFVSEQAAMLSGLPRPVKRLLVLNAASQGDTLDEVARAYTTDGATRPEGCIVTKLDESARPGPALDIAIRYQLPVHCASTGQKVPEDLVFLDAETWIDQALTPSQPVSALFSPSAADLAALMAVPPEPAVKQTARSASSPHALRPGLLALAGGAAQSLSDDSLNAAFTELDGNEVYSSAYARWRRLVSGDTASASGPRPVVAARNELALLGQEWMLALHDAVSVKLEQGRLHALTLMAERGQALTTPWRQWSVGQGWQASDGSSGPQTMPATVRIRRQIDYLNQSAPGTPVLHIFDYPGQVLLRDLSKRGLHWLAIATSATRIEVDGTGTTLGANARTLDYRCLDSALSRMDQEMLRDVPRRHLAVWAAESRVELSMRGSEHLPVRQVSLRLIDRRNGKVLHNLHALNGTVSEPHSLEALAIWLVLGYEARAVSRSTTAMWRALQSHRVDRAVDEVAATAVQMGMAISYATLQRAAVWETLNALTADKKMRAADLPALLSRLFAIRELTDGPAAEKQ